MSVTWSHTALNFIIKLKRLETPDIDVERNVSMAQKRESKNRCKYAWEIIYVKVGIST